MAQCSQGRIIHVTETSQIREVVTPTLCKTCAQDSTRTAESRKKSHKTGSARGGANRRSANAAKRMPFLS